MENQLHLSVKLITEMNCNNFVSLFIHLTYEHNTLSIVWCKVFIVDG